MFIAFSFCKLAAKKQKKKSEIKCQVSEYTVTESYFPKEKSAFS
jgi:hypothetical protein